MTRVRLFGRLSVGQGAPVTHFQTKRTASLFALLTLYPGRDHPREVLIEQLWPGEDFAQTKDRLNQALSWLRRNLPVAITSDRYRVRIESGLVATDVEEFERLLKRAKTERDRQTRQNLLVEAMEASPEPLLVDLDDDWVFQQRQRLTGLKSNALHELIGLLESAGHLSEAIRWAHHLIDLDELEEESHNLLIRLHLIANDIRAARTHYEQLADLFRRRLNLEPSLSLEDLAAYGGTSVQAASLSAPRAATTTFVVPTPANRFIGRSDEIKRIAEWLAGGGTRLITVTGPGGAGKTRLALEAVNRVRTELTGPSWFVPLADVDAPRDIGNAILQIVTRDRKPDRPALAQIIDELSTSPAPVLILDNFEHVAEGASIVATMLDRHPGLRVIATSRQRLNLSAESEIPLGPLSLPVAPDATAAESESVLLFVDRAQLTHRVPPLTSDEWELVHRICSRLEGSPLAIEIAAAWCSDFSLAEILARLDERLAFLVDRRRDIVDRHRSLRAAIDYSYQLLSPDLKAVLASLSVFRGGWTLESATFVVSHPNIAYAIAALTERSLVFARTDGAITRYGMYESIREFAADHLTGSERAVLQGRHAEYFASLPPIGDGSVGLSLSTRLDQMEAELPNAAAALQWCLRHRQAAMGIRIGCAMARIWKSRGPIEEGREWISDFLSFPLEPADRAMGLRELGKMAWIQSDFPAAHAAQQEALTLFTQLKDAPGITEAKFQLAIIAVRTSEMAHAETLLTEILTDGTADDALRARAYLNLGNIAMNTGRRSEAKSFIERCLIIERARNNPERVSFAYNNLGYLAFTSGQYSLATFYLEESIRYGEMSGSLSTADVAYANLARIATRRGQFAKSARYIRLAYEQFIKFGNKVFIRLAIVEYALLLGKLGDYARAAQCLAIADTMTRELGIPFGASELPVYAEAHTVVFESLGPEEYAQIAEFVEMQSAEERLAWTWRLSEDLSENL